SIGAWQGTRRRRPGAFGSLGRQDAAPRLPARRDPKRRGDAAPDRIGGGPRGRRDPGPRLPRDDVGCDPRRALRWCGVPESGDRTRVRAPGGRSPAGRGWRLLGWRVVRAVAGPRERRSLSAGRRVLARVPHRRAGAWSSALFHLARYIGPDSADRAI